MLDQDKILNFIKVTGPTLPSKVAKNIKQDLIIASAHLSDLKSRSKIKISSLKVGGSPLYYLPGQEQQLYNYAQDNMNPKDFQVLERLRNSQILRESNLDLLAKVALRNLKDFAIPLHVTTPQGTELFWKWHLTPSDVANQRIGAILQPPTPVPKPVDEMPSEQTTLIPEEPVKQEAAEVGTPTSELKPEPVVQKEEPKVEPTPEPIQEETPVVKETKEPVKETKPKKEVKKPAPKKKSTKKVEEKKPKKEEKKPAPKKVEKKVEPKTEPKAAETVKPKVKPLKSTDPLFNQAQEYLNSMEINVLKKETIRKRSELDLIVEIPSVVGKITYFTKVKSKARCDEKDLSSAYMEAQIKKRPLLFLYTKELTKKAQEMLESGVFENTIVKSINDGN